MFWDLPTDYLLYIFCLGLSLVLAALGALSGPAGLFNFGVNTPDLHLDVHLEGHFEVVPGHAAGGHHLPHLEHDYGLPRYSLLNPIALLAFLGSFGALGLIARGIGLGPWLALSMALSGGILLSIVLFSLFARFVLGSEAAAVQSTQAAIGRLATVTVAIPEAGLGSVAYVLGGQRHTIAARLAGGQPLSSGEEVVIVGLDQHQNVAIVQPFERQ